MRTFRMINILNSVSTQLSSMEFALSSSLNCSSYQTLTLFSASVNSISPLDFPSSSQMKLTHF